MTKTIWLRGMQKLHVVWCFSPYIWSSKVGIPYDSIPCEMTHIWEIKVLKMKRNDRRNEATLYQRRILDLKTLGTLSVTLGWQRPLWYSTFYLILPSLIYVFILYVSVNDNMILSFFVICRESGRESEKP
jgi:hypothetical protein